MASPIEKVHCIVWLTMITTTLSQSVSAKKLPSTPQDVLIATIYAYWDQRIHTLFRDSVWIHIRDSSKVKVWCGLLHKCINWTVFLSRKGDNVCSVCRHAWTICLSTTGMQATYHNPPTRRCTPSLGTTCSSCIKPNISCPVDRPRWSYPMTTKITWHYPSRLIYVGVC